jgi:hypothetical protein
MGNNNARSRRRAAAALLKAAAAQLFTDKVTLRCFQRGHDNRPALSQEYRSWLEKRGAFCTLSGTSEKIKLKKLREKDAENLTSDASASGQEESKGERTMLISCVTTGNKTGPTHSLAPPPPAGSRDESPLAYTGDFTSATIAEDDDDAEADADGRDAAEKIDEAAAAVGDSEEAAQGEVDQTHAAKRRREEAAEASSKARSAKLSEGAASNKIQKFLKALKKKKKKAAEDSEQAKVSEHELLL